LKARIYGKVKIEVASPSTITDRDDNKRGSGNEFTNWMPGA
jgi:hypothetical protein